MLQRLDDGPLTVSELAEPFDVTLTAITQHVRSLERAGLIHTTKVGRQRTCTLDPETLGRAEAWIHQRRQSWQNRTRPTRAPSQPTRLDPTEEHLMTTDLAHDTLIFERHLRRPAGDVFNAYADIDQRVLWSAPSDDEVVIFESHDFSVGGVDRFICGPKSAPSFAGTTRYHAIVDGETIVFTERLTDLDHNLAAVSLVTWHVGPDGDGSKLTIVDQVTSIVGSGPIDGSRHGYNAMLDQLEHHLDPR